MERQSIRFFVLLAMAAGMLLTGAACQNREEASLPAGAASSTQRDSVPAVADDSPPATGLPVLFQDQASPHLVEEQSQALALWRRHRQERPALLIFSAKPPRPIPESLAGQVERLLDTGREEEIERRVARPVADRLLQADMAVAAAIGQGWISRVIWVVPLREGEVMLPLARFKELMREQAGGWGAEIEEFDEKEEGVFAGHLGGVPVEVVTAERLPEIDEPLLVHIDAGYIAASYRNEVKTPFLGLIEDLAEKVAGGEYRALEVSVSFDNLSYEIPLGMRFLAPEIAATLRDPVRVKQPPPIAVLRGEMLYLDNFYQPATIRKKAEALLQIAPKDAAAYYSRYRAYRQERQLDQALAALEQAIALDPVYADEYIELVDHAAQGGQHAAALAMLDSAIRAMPDNPFIRLRKAQLLVGMGRGDEAVETLQTLARLPWTEDYYPFIREQIEGLLLKAREED